MKQIRKRLTYANVMSSIAVFIVLGGAAFAAVKLPKNSVGAKQLKKNAVTTQKIKNGAVTGAKVNVTGFPKVPNAAQADNAANASHASSADSAGTAGSATNAKHAQFADEAGSVEGSTIVPFFFSEGATTVEEEILSLDGLTLTAKCEGGNTELLASTDVPNAEFHAGGTYLFATAFYVERDNFDPGETVDLLEEESDSVQGTFTYATEDGAVVTGTFLAEEGGFNEFEADCIVSGNAIG